MAHDVPAGNFDGCDPAVGGEAGGGGEPPYIPDPPEDLGRQDGTDAEVAREATSGVLHGCGDLLVDADDGGVKATHLADQVHGEQSASPRGTDRGADVAEQGGGSSCREVGWHLTRCELGEH